MLKSSIVALAFVTSAASAAVSPFTENFAADSANWYNNNSSAPVGWSSSGGPDGSSYATTSFNFGSFTPGVPIPGNTAVLFRAQDEFNSSGNALVGDWVAGGINELSFWVRHDAPEAVTFFARFATPANSPAWSGIGPAVAPNVWTQVTLPLSIATLTYEGPPGAGQTQFNNVFGNLGHVQIGAFAQNLAGLNQDITFDLDQVSIVPAPAALAMLLPALFLNPRRRRN